MVPMKLYPTDKSSKPPCLPYFSWSLKQRASIILHTKHGASPQRWLGLGQNPRSFYFENLVINKPAEEGNAGQEEDGVRGPELEGPPKGPGSCQLL